MAAIRTLTALLVVVTLGACSAQQAAPVTAASTPTRGASAPWLVTIVVDQLAAWIAAERWSQLPSSGGFARLRREGLTVRDLRFAHAVTDTAPGHSALATGEVPHASGIVSNDVIAPDGKKVSILNDQETRLVPVGGAGPLDRAGSSLAALTGDTVADALVAARPGARVFAFSLKDRGALFGGGRHPELMLWLDTDGGTFVTSSAFARALPAWVIPLGDAGAVAGARVEVWSPLDPAWLEAHAETLDEQDGEGDYLGLGTRFPHRASSVKAQRATPAGDEMLFNLARGTIAQAAAGPRGVPVLLALSLSSNDYIGHVFGPNSREAWDELLRLDRRLAELMAVLDAAVGSSGYAMMLTGDHGITPLPEISRSRQGRWCRGSGTGGTPDFWGRPCGRGRRLAPREIASAAESEAQALFGSRGGTGGGKWVLGVAEPFVYLSERGRALSAPDRAALVGRLEAVLRARYDVERVVDVRAAPATCPPEADDSLSALICRAIRSDQRGDFFIVGAPGTFFDPELAAGAGTSHGSPYLYDRAVPLVIRAPGRIPAGAIEAGPVSFSAFARTAAALLGVPPPAGATTGPDLTVGAAHGP